MAPFKSSDGRNLGKLIVSYGTRYLGVGLTEPSNLVTGPITATGGNKYTPGNGYIYHAFTNSMNASPDGIFEQTGGGDTIDVLIVAGGGGGGGGYYGGGGGGGGILEGTVPGHQPGPITVTVGAGGDGGIDLGGQATNGGNSSFGSVIALGGGFGGSGPRTPDQYGGTGGSGGGSSYYTSPGIGTASPQPAPGDYTAYGNASAESRDPGTVGAGGGGAGGAGSGKPGGDGRAFPTWPSSVIPILTPLNPQMGPGNNTYGGGGGGGPNGTGGTGGGGGAPDGGAYSYLGGGGGGRGTNPGTGGAGGDGIVLIRYSAS